MIWRPNFNRASGTKDFFLELNLTDETLSFTEISGDLGVANRGSLQKDAFRAAADVQTINDVFDGSGQHFSNPVSGPMCQTRPTPAKNRRLSEWVQYPMARRSTCRGRVFRSNRRRFDPSSITPFQIGSPDDGENESRPFRRRDAVDPEFVPHGPRQSRSLTQAQLSNPNLFLSQAIANQTIISTTVLSVRSDNSLPPPAPDVGEVSTTSPSWSGKELRLRAGRMRTPFRSPLYSGSNE